MLYPPLALGIRPFKPFADTVLGLNPDLIIHYAPIDKANIALAREIQNTLGIPTVLVDNALQGLPDALRLVGQLLGRELRGQALATFVENRLKQTANFQRLQHSYEPIPVHIVSPFEPGHFNELLSLAGMVEMPTWNDEPPLPDFVLIMPHSIADPYKAIERDGHKRIYQIPSPRIGLNRDPSLVSWDWNGFIPWPIRALMRQTWLRLTPPSWKCSFR